MARVALLTLIAALLGGCVSGEVSSGEQDAMRREFSKDNYEEAMIKAGRGEELEAEKRKEQEYLNAGGADQQ